MTTYDVITEGHVFPDKTIQFRFQVAENGGEPFFTSAWHYMSRDAAIAAGTDRARMDMLSVRQREFIRKETTPVVFA